MFPSLILIKTPQKNRVAYTWKKSFQIGTNEECDLVLFDPDLIEAPAVLGAGERGGVDNGIKTALLRSFLSVHGFRKEDVRVFLIRLKTISSAMCILCTAFILVTTLPKRAKYGSHVQDWTPVTLPAQGVYGFCRQDRTHGEGVRFVFNAKSKKPHQLGIVFGGRGNGTTVTLSLNGTSFHPPIDLPAGWGERTILPLPVPVMVSGQNILEIRPVTSKDSPPDWGIRDIAVQPATPWHIGKPSLAQDRQPIRTALLKPDIGGPALAFYYTSLTSTGDFSAREDDSTSEMEDLKETIEGKMRTLLQQTTFQIRSRETLGDQAGAKDLLDELKAWMPINWREGWDLYHEFCRRDNSDL